MLAQSLTRAGPARSIAAILFVAATAAAAADAPASSPEALFSMSAEAQSIDKGKSLSMTMREIMRGADFSVAEIEAGAEAARSRSASLFLVRGLCGLMVARGQKVAVAEQVSEQPIRFKVTFPERAVVEERKGAPRLVLSEANCAGIEERLR